jgi:glutathione synthase/RimK-type ligase-like ATP-grasp enzyme
VTVAVFTHTDDLHALVVQDALARSFGIPCHIVEVDALWRGSGLKWSTDNGVVVPTRAGKQISLSSIDLIWWRRPTRSQALPETFADAATSELITNDCRAALVGSVLADFQGNWVSEPAATSRAEHKLVQLRVAEKVGFRVPRTLVSQDPGEIRQFCTEVGGRMVIKPLRGSMQRMTLTQFVTTETLPPPDSARVCPAMYQEFVPGNRHIRAHCFGEEVLAVLIESDALDWRADLRVPVKPVELPVAAQDRLRAVVSELNLRMGIFDLKLTTSDELVWLEVNPQGQFLFVQGLCGLDLATAFAGFLREESRVT